ncbi:MAG: hypothetical protein H6668_03450 [Ardenticatenaceae bacterium]|nr:hypothetical protein [Ardenticatenaceae bacterium]
MMKQKESNSPPQLSIRATLAAGFDLTTKHMWLLILPVLLDCFYWLGPRLSFTTLFQSLMQLLLSEFQQEAALQAFSSDLFTQIPATNLFTSISLPFIGVPALMLTTPEKTPLVTSLIEIQSLGNWFGLLMGLLLVGLFLSTIYLTLMGRVAMLRVAAGVVTRGNVTAVLPSELTDHNFWQLGDIAERIWYVWPRLLALGLAFFLFLLMLYIPSVIVGTILALLVGPLGFATLFLVPLVGMWVVIYLCFVPHGLIRNGRSLRRAIVESGMIVHSQLSTVLTLLLTIWLINATVDSLLLWAEDGTWFTLIAIIGHAFISTATLMATFIFYQDRYTTLYRGNY